MQGASIQLRGYPAARQPQTGTSSFTKGSRSIVQCGRCGSASSPLRPLPHVTDNARRHTRHDGVVRHVFGDDGSGTSLVTTAPAPTIAPWPTVTPPMMVQLLPRDAWDLIRVLITFQSVSLCRFPSALTARG